MATPETVLVHLSENRFTEGFYRIDGDTLIMTYRDGTDVEPPVRCVLKPTDRPIAIAAVLTKKIRETMASPFWNDLELKDQGIA